MFSQWRDSSLLQLMFSSGLFVNVNVNVFTGDPVSITFDKFLVGKLLSDYVADGKRPCKIFENVKELVYLIYKFVVDIFFLQSF